MTQKYINALAKAIEERTSNDAIREAARDLVEALESQVIEQARIALKRQGYIPVLWGIDDVKELRPDLTDDQAMQVLERCIGKHDAGIGINWLVLEITADDMFSAPEEGE